MLHSTRYKRCSERLIREEIEDREFMEETAQGVLGRLLCFESFMRATGKKKRTG